MNKAFLTLWDQIPGRSVHKFNNVCEKITKSNITVFIYESL